MAVMAPLESVNVSLPPPIAAVQSVYSGNGVMAPTNPVNVAPINYATNYGNPYGGYNGGMAPVNQQQSGGGSILGDIGNLRSAGQFVSNGFQLPQSGFINGIGSNFGFASAANGAPAASGAIGPTLSGANAGSLGTTATASSVLGAAGIGAFAGSFLGRIGGNATGGSIGGGVGAGIGMAVGGPVGAAIGGLIGGIGGGFFGGKKKGTSASEFGGTLDATGTLGGFSYGAKNAKGYDGYNKSLSEEMAAYMTQAKQYLGISEYKSIGIRGGVNTRHSPSGQPGFITVGDKHYGFNPDDNASRQNAIGQAVAALAKNSGATDEQIKGMADRLAYDATPQGKAQKFMPFVPIKDNQKFADYMAKYKSQTVVQGNNAPANPVTGSTY